MESEDSFSEFSAWLLSSSEDGLFGGLFEEQFWGMDAAAPDFVGEQQIHGGISIAQATVVEPWDPLQGPSYLEQPNPFPGTFYVGHGTSLFLFFLSDSLEIFQQPRILCLLAKQGSDIVTYRNICEPDEKCKAAWTIHGRRP